MGDSDHVVSRFREDPTSHFLETSNLDGEANLKLATSEGQESKEETRDEELTRSVCRSTSGIDECDGLKKGVFQSNRGDIRGSKMLCFSFQCCHAFWKTSSDFSQLGIISNIVTPLSIGPMVCDFILVESTRMC